MDNLWPEPPPSLGAPPPPAAAETSVNHRPYTLVYSYQQHHCEQYVQQLQPLPPSNSYFYPPDPNPNPIDHPITAAGIATSIHYPPVDPIVDPYAPSGGYEGLRPPPYYPYAGGALPPSPSAVAAASAAARMNATSSYYYSGSIGAAEEPPSFPVKMVVPQYVADPINYGAGLPGSSAVLEPMNPAHPRPLQGKRKVLHQSSKPIKKDRKFLKKTTKVVQSAFCAVCKIVCDTEDVLKGHKQGKKHKKNLEKLQESIKVKPTSTIALSGGLVLIKEKETAAVEKGKVAGDKTKRKNAPATVEELEEKKRRVIEGGAAAEELKVCTICNVVVNSQKVFEYHIAGQKHTALVKQQREQQAARKEEEQAALQEEEQAARKEEQQAAQQEEEQAALQERQTAWKEEPQATQQDQKAEQDEQAAPDS